MDLSNLKPAAGSTHSRKRVGRGEGGGYGLTAGRGHKGAQSRSGYKQKFGFEGGQMPLMRRVPKYGFTNLNRVEYTPINLDVLEQVAERLQKSEVSFDDLVAVKRVHKDARVKILGGGEITTALKVSAHAFSKSAKEAIEKAGGEAVII